MSRRIEVAFVLQTAKVLFKFLLGSAFHGISFSAVPRRVIVDTGWGQAWALSGFKVDSRNLLLTDLEGRRLPVKEMPHFHFARTLVGDSVSGPEMDESAERNYSKYITAQHNLTPRRKSIHVDRFIRLSGEMKSGEMADILIAPSKTGHLVVLDGAHRASIRLALHEADGTDAWMSCAIFIGQRREKELVEPV